MPKSLTTGAPPQTLLGKLCYYEALLLSSDPIAVQGRGREGVPTLIFVAKEQRCHAWRPNRQIITDIELISPSK